MMDFVDIGLELVFTAIEIIGEITTHKPNQKKEKISKREKNE